MKNNSSICILVGMLSCTLLFHGCVSEQADERPNIVIFIADDTGFNDVGYHGSVITTPHIDRLASQGLVLDQHYVYPVCSPTRAALMTGRPPSRFGIMGPLQPYTDFRFEKGTPMLASVLKSAGYETCLDGKWHLGMEPDQLPNCFGFDHSYGYTGPWIDSYSLLVGNWRGDGSGIRHWHRDGQLIEELGHVTDLITQEAVSFISERRDRSKPFFLYVAYSAPHVPCQEPKKYTDPYEGIIENNSRLFFAAAMTHLDESMGEITSCLEEEGLTENTIVIFMSDNGGQRGGDYGTTGSGWMAPPDEYNMAYALSDSLGDNTPLRNWKGSLYEGGIRVPSFVRWTGRFNPGTIEIPVHVCDWLPTLAGLAGAEVPPEMHAEGMDVMPILDGNPPVGDRVLYWNSSRQQAVRKGPWKLIRSETRGDEKQERFELFNIDQDPVEAEDLSSAQPDLMQSLKAELERNMALDK
jgi:arylsulfatase A-like enzyme